MRKALLTIDDSPSSITKEILDVLDDRHLSAIFFCIGNKLLESKAIVDRMVCTGVIIGNHSYSHKHFSKLTLTECKQEILKTEELIEDAYKRNKIKRPYKYFRFPYGDKGGENKGGIQEFLRMQGFERVTELSITYDWYKENGLDIDHDVFWTFDCMDYLLSDKNSTFTIENMRERFVEDMPKWGGSLVCGTSDEIILFHDHEKTNVECPKYYEIILDEIQRMVPALEMRVL